MKSEHWDKVYQSKAEDEVSWFQAIPEKSLELISELKLGLSDKILDVGGGDSRLVDNLLQKGFTDITVVDISAAALARTRERLAENSKKVTLITSDITKFTPVESYRLWHDRATFHFLTSADDVSAYLEIANRAIAPGGYLIVSTFSKTGPEKCSGLPITQYSDEDLKKLFTKHFVNIKCVEDQHTTPWKSVQNFVYCGFKKRG